MTKRYLSAKEVAELLELQNQPLTQLSVDGIRN